VESDLNDIGKQFIVQPLKKLAKKEKAMMLITSSLFLWFYD